MPNKAEGGVQAPYRAAVLGFGAVCGAGHNSEEVWQSLLVRRAQPVAMTGLFPGGLERPCFVVGRALTPQLAVGLEQRVPGLAETNRTILLALTALEEALVMADLRLDHLPELRVGVALGTTVGCSFHNEDYYRQWKEGGQPSPTPLATYLAANLAAVIQQALGVRGPRAVVTNACASSTDAIGMARSWLQHGFCDLAIAGGADELSRIASHGFHSLMLVSGDKCRPFDEQRQGLNLGEGAGIMVLAREDSPLLAERQVAGWVRGYGLAGDGYHPTAPHPQARGLVAAVRMALADAGLEPGQIALINAHGTGTSANDLAETGAIAALGFTPGKTAMVSTKGATGHTLGAAGGLEAIFTLLALQRGHVTGTVSCNQLDPAFAYQPLIETEERELRGRVGISQSLAFGGSNGVLVLEAGQ